MDSPLSLSSYSESSPVGRPRRATPFMVKFFLAGCGSALILVGMLFAVKQFSVNDEGAPTWSVPVAPVAVLDFSPVPQQSPGPPACHDVSEHENGPCNKAMSWGRTSGWHEHPEWFNGLTNKSSIEAWQSWTSHMPPWGKCPIPCNYAQDEMCARLGTTPKMWRPAVSDKTVDIKILSYNLFWWHLFDLNKGVYSGQKHSAGKLIKSTGPYDVLGFQECKNHTLLLGPMGLLEEYEAFEGWREICIAYRKKTWTLLDHGTRQVSVDQPTEWYGTRGTQWMRLQHKETGQKLFFGNHHGPLSVNSGGQCGGVSTAHNMLKLVEDKAEVGDAVIIVGDFNANAQSITIQELWKNLVLLYNGKSFGGVDNVFGNMPLSSVIEAKELGSGGSDHEAISTTVRLGGPSPSLRSAALAGAEEPFKAQRDADVKSQCGILENDVEYIFPSGPSKTIPHIDPRACCTACKTAHCTAWTYLSFDHAVKGNRCFLYSTQSTSFRPRLGAVSGLPPNVAAKKAAIEMAGAIKEIPA